MSYILGTQHFDTKAETDCRKDVSPMIDQPDPDEIKLADAYEDACYLLGELDKLIVRERHVITHDDPAVKVRWALAHFIHDYDTGEILSYGDYLALVLQAQNILEGNES